MKSVSIELTDAEFDDLINKARAVHGKCEQMTDKALIAPEAILPVWAKMNLQYNADFFAEKLRCK